MPYKRRFAVDIVCWSLRLSPRRDRARRRQRRRRRRRRRSTIERSRRTPYPHPRSDPRFRDAEESGEKRPSGDKETWGWGNRGTGSRERKSEEEEKSTQKSDGLSKDNNRRRLPRDYDFTGRPVGYWSSGPKRTTTGDSPDPLPPLDDDDVGAYSPCIPNFLPGGPVDVAIAHMRRGGGGTSASRPRPRAGGGLLSSCRSFLRASGGGDGGHATWGRTKTRARRALDSPPPLTASK